MCTIFIHYYNLCGHTPFTITTKILDQHTPSYSFNYYFYNISIFHYRFFYKSASWEMSNEDFDKLLSSYLEHHGESPTITTYSGNISQVSGNENAKAQFHILGTISNYHWHGYPSMYDPSTIAGQTQIRYMQHMITSPDKRFIPSSPRNRILHFIKSAESEQLIQAILFLIRLDKQDEKSNQDTECPEPSPKKRRRTVITKRID